MRVSKSLALTKEGLHVRLIETRKATDVTEPSPPYFQLQLPRYGSLRMSCLGIRQALYGEAPNDFEEC